MERTSYGGWNNNVRLANDQVELILTADVGPRVIRFGFIGEKNLFGEIPGQMGTSGEDEWMNRGGHRLWIAPEEKPKSYELDNKPYTVEEIPRGVRTLQEPGEVTGVAKSMDISLAENANRVDVVHTLTNRGNESITLSPWALTVMALAGTAVVPLPEKVAHTERLTHNQEWSLWGYTDFADTRWTLGSRYVRFRQDPSKGPGKLGIAHREGWVAYCLDNYVFIKRFSFAEGKAYPDGGVNFETFANEEILELESIGPLATLSPGESATHKETWSLHKNVPECATEEDIDRHIRPLSEP